MMKCLGLVIAHEKVRLAPGTPISRRHSSLKRNSYVLIVFYVHLSLIAFTICANYNSISFNIVSITLFSLYSSSNRGRVGDPVGGDVDVAATSVTQTH